MPEQLPECNGLHFEGYDFDVFLSGDGSLGFTVYPRGKSGTNENDDTSAVDIFVSPNADKVTWG